MTEHETRRELIYPRIAEERRSGAPARFPPLRHVVTTALMVLVAACESDRATAGSAEFPVRFLVFNELVAPVTISIDGVPHIGLRPGENAGLAVPSTAQWLTWTSAKPMDASGQPIPDDIGEVRIAIGGINRALEISNVIADQPYITALIYNTTSAHVSIGVYDGSAVSCAAQLPASSGTASGFTRIGYYRLLPGTELRAYRASTGCSGPHVSWSAAQLKDFAPKSGLLALSLDSAP